MPTNSHFTSGEVGDLLGVQAWKVARLFELGIIPEPTRVGGRRLIHKPLIPDIVIALRERGWLNHDGWQASEPPPQPRSSSDQMSLPITPDDVDQPHEQCLSQEAESNDRSHAGEARDLL